MVLHGPGAMLLPEGRPGPVPPTLPLTLAALGLSGDPEYGTYGDFTSYTLSQFCQPKQPQPPGHGGTGVSNGDPYITTFDGGGYGFQTAGEFTLVKSITTTWRSSRGRSRIHSTLSPSSRTAWR